MSPPGRPMGEHRRAKPEGAPVNSIACRLLLALSLAALLPQHALARKPKARDTVVADNAAGTYATRQDVRDFAAQLAERRQLPVEWVQAQLAQARPQPAAQRLMMPPPAGTAKNWAAYRDRFVEPQRIAAGMRFWQEQADWLERAQTEYGVPAHIVVGIVGVETFYGRVTGNFRVLDALATLAFDFPSGRSDRSALFRSELEEFLVRCQREGVDPAVPKGSFAGAMGLPQFMPSSLSKWAVDFDGDGRIDLDNSGADVVGSVAHYLLAHGWQRDMPPFYAVAPPVDTSNRATLLQPDILPSFSAEQMVALGAGLDEEGRAHAGPLALVELQNGNAAPSFVAGTQNFYAITRYNQSSYYAMAVIALGEAVKARR